MSTVTVSDWDGKEVCSTCFGSGFVDPWAEDADYPCPACHPQAYQSADEYFAVSDALELHRERDGLSDGRVARAERAQLQEQPFTQRAMDLDRTERNRAAGW